MNTLHEALSLLFHDSFLPFLAQSYSKFFALFQRIIDLHYRKVSDNTTTFTSVETDVTSIQLQELSPNTQYSLYITAVVLNNGSRVESTPSETLIAWTDPAFPAFVEVMIIKLFLGC